MWEEMLLGTVPVMYERGCPLSTRIFTVYCRMRTDASILVLAILNFEIILKYPAKASRCTRDHFESNYSNGCVGFYLTPILICVPKRNFSLSSVRKGFAHSKKIRTAGKEARSR